MDRKRADRNIFLVILGIWIAALLFGAVVYKSHGLDVDYAILNAIHVREFPGVTRVMKAFTVSGDPLFYIVVNLVAIVWLLRKKKYPELFCMLAAVLVGWGMNEVLKHLFLRIRPEGYALIEQGGYSYPSGHSMVAMAWYPTVGFLLQYRRPQLARTGMVFALFGFLPGVSRLFLGVHYPTDVLFGHLLGITIAYLCIRIYVEYKRKIFPEEGYIV